jgi:hypothetical protein
MFSAYDFSLTDLMYLSHLGSNLDPRVSGSAACYRISSPLIPSDDSPYRCQRVTALRIVYLTESIRGLDFLRFYTNHAI